MSETQGHFADRLLAAVEKKGSPVCVGIDPNVDRMPKQYRAKGDNPMAQLERVSQFCADVLEIVAPYTPAVKPQIAYFEQLHGPHPFFGMALYASVVRAAQKLGLIVIGDVKRGDIGSTASAYARAHLAEDNAADAVTVNGYFGIDGIRPFMDVAEKSGRGAFVLVRTSNPSAGTVQDFTDTDGRTLFEHVAGQVAEYGSGMVGACGYSALGAVVGATYPDEARKLRNIMPQQIFLVPGYGAQGATADDCAASFKPDGTGAIVNASRSVIYAHHRYPEMDWKKAVETAVKEFAKDIRLALA